MKPRFLFTLLLTVPALGRAEPVDFLDLDERNGLYYRRLSDVPFTGSVNGDAQGTLRRGNRVGSWQFYYQSGRLWSIATYNDGMSEGPLVSYYENGKLWFKGNFKDDKADGSFEWYRDNGQLERKAIYKNDELINQICFSDTGKETPCW